MIMSGNATQNAAGVRLSRPDLEYFDKLPPTARHALAGAVFDWSAGAILNRWKRGAREFKTGADIAARVAEWDQRQIEKDRARVWRRL
jgi:hypothetical protein